LGGGGRLSGIALAWSGSYIWLVRDPASQPTYRGSSKHKDRPVRGIKGTLCPEWTHRTTEAGLGSDVLAHNWQDTEASRLFAAALVDHASGRRFATARGIAFEAKPTEDGTWHGFPIPWVDVPDEHRRQWLKEGKVTHREIKKFLSFSWNDIHWALVTD
jgi:hypothetical protein